MNSSLFSKAEPKTIVFISPCDEASFLRNIDEGAGDGEHTNFNDGTGKTGDLLLTTAFATGVNSEAKSHVIVN